MSKTTILHDLLLVALGAVLGGCLGYFSAKAPQTPTETEHRVVTDTLTVTMPVLRDSVVTKTVTRTLTVVERHEDAADTVYQEATVEIPIEQKHYSGEGYEAWVSGFEAALDSIKVERLTETVTERITVAAPRERWHLGVTAGYGATPQGMQPYVGVGLTYSIFGF